LSIGRDHYIRLPAAVADLVDEVAVAEGRSRANAAARLILAG
jgi:hypothetical protein